MIDKTMRQQDSRWKHVSERKQSAQGAFHAIRKRSGCFTIVEPLFCELDLGDVFV